MEGWNPIGWLLMAGGFMSIALVGGPQAGHVLWLASYAAMLAGLTILTSNMLRAIWRSIRARRVIRGRLRA